MSAVVDVSVVVDVSAAVVVSAAAAVDVSAVVAVSVEVATDVSVAMVVVSLAVARVQAHLVSLETGRRYCRLPAEWASKESSMVTTCLRVPVRESA